MNPGDLVWWHSTDTILIWGHVREFDGDMVRVETCHNGELVYLPQDQPKPAAELPDGVYGGFPYHSNPARLSPNGARKLVQPGGPAKFDYQRTHPEEPKSHFDFGHVIHRLVLGEGEDIAPVYADNWTTKAAKEQRDKARAEGLVPILAKDFDRAREMAAAVHQHPEAARLLADGDAEQWLYATDPETGQGLRQRLDWMTQLDGRLHIVEYKSAADADPKVFARKAYDYGYHIAFAFAVLCAHALELDDSPAYLIIAQEKDAPYLPSVCEFDLDAYQCGKEQVRKAIQIFRQCNETGMWPGYGDGIHSISLPPWAFRTDHPTIGDVLKVEAS